MTTKTDSFPVGAATKRGKTKDPAAGALHQVGALPLRMGAGGIEVCLITTRQTGRWTIPKGWPMKGKSDRQAAAIEAREEGGLIGDVGKKPIGSFLYWKRRLVELELIRVEVYRLDVTRQLTTWKEADERFAQWFTAREAWSLVDEPGLRSLIDALDDSDG